MRPRRLPLLLPLLELALRLMLSTPSLASTLYVYLPVYRLPMVSILIISFVYL